jgi:hypothetical protein
MNERKVKGQQLVALFLVGCLLFNYPLLSLFSHNGLVWGIPTFYLYTFMTWAGLIGLMAIVIEYRGNK